MVQWILEQQLLAQAEAIAARVRYEESLLTEEEKRDREEFQAMLDYLATLPDSSWD
jgi:hypothetical protein